MKIWSELLSLSGVGIDDNFFDFGGHSLKASLLVSGIHKELQVKIPLAEVFKCPTIRELAQYITMSAPDQYSPLEKVEEKEYYPLSSVQEKIYALQQLDRESTAYNVSPAMMVEGIVDKKRLEEAFKTLIRRHEILRTSFGVIGETLVQKIHQDMEFEVEYYCAERSKLPPKIP